MDAFLIMLKNVLVFVLLAVPGVIVVKTKMLKSQQSTALSKVLLYVGAPFLVIDKMFDISFDGELLKVVIISAVLGVGFNLFCVFLSRFAVMREKEVKTKGITRFCMVFANNGFLGFPLVSAVFPDRPLVMVALVIFNIICCVFMYTIGVVFVTGDKRAMSLKKAVFNPILIAFIVGLLLNLIKMDEWLPESTIYAGHLSGLVTPLSMVILGMKLGEVNVKNLFASPKMYYVSAIKLIVEPVLVLSIGYALNVFFGIGVDVLFALFIAFALPTATTSTALADGYGGDVNNAAIFTLGTTMLSIATIPPLYGLLVLLI